MTWAVFQSQTDKRGYSERPVSSNFETFEAAQAWLQRNLKVEHRDGYSVRRV